MSDGHTQYGNMNLEAAMILLVVINKLSPNDPIELTDADYQAVANRFENGPALSAVKYRLADVLTLELSVIDAGEAQKIAAATNLPRRK